MPLLITEMEASISLPTKLKILPPNCLLGTYNDGDTLGQKRPKIASSYKLFSSYGFYSGSLTADIVMTFADRWNATFSNWEAGTLSGSTSGDSIDFTTMFNSFTTLDEEASGVVEITTQVSNAITSFYASLLSPYPGKLLYC
jgi:hypothetical protein